MAISKIGTNSLGNVADVSSSTTLSLKTAGTTAVTIDASQNVGIGTSSPGAKLQVNTATNNDGIFIDNTSTADATSKQPRLVFRGTDTVGTIKSAAAIVSVPENSNIVNTSMAIFTRGSDTFTEKMRITSAGLLQFNSGYGSVATAYGCRAWVNFNGTGTPSIRGSGGVSSISDLGTGTYNINFSTAMPDTNYSTVTGCSEGEGSGNLKCSAGRPASTSAVTVVTGDNNSDNVQDFDNVNVSVFR
jgi:hypothetical protein